MQIQRRVTIKSPPEFNWDVFTNLRRAKEWAPGFEDYPYISPEWPARNAKAVWRYHAGLLTFDFELTINESVRGPWPNTLRKPVIRFLSPLMKPLFRWNHNWTMPRGEWQIAEYLSRQTKEQA